MENQPDERILEAVGIYLGEDFSLTRFILQLVLKRSEFSLAAPLAIMVTLAEGGITGELSTAVERIFDEHWKTFEDETSKIEEELHKTARTLFWFGYVMGLRRAGQEELSSELSFPDIASGVLEAKRILRVGEKPPDVPPT